MLALLLLAPQLRPLQGVAAPYSVPLAEPAADLQSSSSPFGVAGAMRWPNWGTFNLPAAALAATGAGWAREDFAWGLIEPSPGKFDWTATDRLVGALRERKINILGIVSYSAAWATPAREDDGAGTAVSFYAPDLESYYNFVRTLVARYKESVRHWEVWNEPDNSLFFKPAPSAAAYAGILKTAYRAIKDVDPGIRVVSGGVSGNATPFLEEVIAAGAAQSFDVLGLHPYAVPLDGAQGKIQSRPDVHRLSEIQLQKYRALLQRHSLGSRPIWITEIGWPASNWGLDSAAQARYLAQAYTSALSSGLVEKVFWYSFKDDSADPADSWGLVAWGSGKTDLAARRPSFKAYSTLATLLAGLKPAGTVPFGRFTPIEDFDDGAAWMRSTHRTGALEISAEQRHSGAAAGKLTYSFDGANQAVDFAPPGGSIPLPGRPTRISLHVLGDPSGNYLSAWLRDKDGELFKVRLGSVSAPAGGWQYFEASLNSYYFDWERALGSPANGKPDYPLSFVSVRLENTPDQPPSSGVIFLDNLSSFQGPDISVSRFTRADGQVLDVLVSAGAAEVTYPTGSASARVIDLEGSARDVAPRDGALSLNLPAGPLYVIHRPIPAPSDGRPGAPAHCAAGARAQPIGGDTLYFPETAHNLGGAFRRFWDSHGGIMALGFPITEEFVAPSTEGKNYVQQFFQRARLEFHPENPPDHQVQLGLLGVWVTSGRTFPAAAVPPAGSRAGYFPETGHSLDLFSAWWNRNGGLAMFGYPISGELQEQNAADGKTYAVQYFERNRLEHHPENASTPNEVLLGLLGVEFLVKQGCPPR